MKKVHELTVANSTKQDVVLEHRANTRYKTASFALVTNLSQGMEQVTALLHDVSSTGIRIQTTLCVAVNDALRIDLPDLMVLAEVIHFRALSEGAEVGLKLVHSLGYEELRRCLDPVWAEFHGSEDRKPWNAVSVVS